LPGWDGAMLRRVKISGFRSCRDVELDDLGAMTVLVGRNAVGKTNMLRGIRWLAKTATSLEGIRPPITPGIASMEFALPGTTYFYSLKTSRQVIPPGAPGAARRIHTTMAESLAFAAGDGVRQPAFERHNENVTLWPSETRVEIGHNASCMPALVSVLPPDSEVARLIRPLLSALETVRYYPLTEGDDEAAPIPQATYEDWLVHYRATGDPGPSVLMRLLHVALDRQADFEEIRSLLGPDGLGLLANIDARTFEGRGKEGKKGGQKFYWLTFAPAMQGSDTARHFGFEDLSSGTRRIVRMIVSLIFDQSAIMLLEHPEEGIHRGLLRKLIDVLRTYSGRCQLIIASHSAVVFDTLDPKSVRLVTMSEGETKVRPLTAEELDAARKYLEEEGTLSDFLEVVDGG